MITRASSSSFQLSHDLKIRKSHGSVDHHIGGVGKDGFQLTRINLSSHAMRQDVGSFNLLSSVQGSISPVSCRCNVFVCQSVLLPGGGNEAPLLKSTAMVLTRAYNSLRGSPLLLKLIPAVGTIAFAAWGLGPLMRRGRVIFLHKTDGNWKKSSTHHVMASYLQPLLFWAGVILICRALDPIELPFNAGQAVKQRFLNFVRSLSTVLAFACCLSNLIQQAQKFFMEANDSADTRNMGFDFAGKAVYTAVWVAAVSLFMELLGFSTQKWLTAGGLGTVLLTLAGREILTNFLSSVMIHATRPFVLNEWIQTKIEGYEVSGTVEHVGWWSPTIIRGDDREAVHIPNHKFTVNIVRNLTQKSHWRIKTHLAICHLDVSKINNIVADMRKVLSKNPQIEQQRLHRRVFLEDINAENQALMILVSCFVKTSRFEEYLCVKEAVLQDLLRVIRHHRARLATPIRTVQKYSDTNLDNVAFSDIISTEASTYRPLMLIDPSNKVNREDKVKSSSAHSVQRSEEKDSKAGAPLDSQAEAKDESVEVDAPKKDKLKAASSSNYASSRASRIPASESKRGNVVPDQSVDHNSKEKIKESKGDLQKVQRGHGSDNAAMGLVLEKPPLPNAESGAEKSDDQAVTSQRKRENAMDLITRPPLEENIVLGVALDGSKRTLPIEEEMNPSARPVDSKEVAAD